MTTPKLQMPELVVGQAGKELTHNQALAVLDQLAQAVVVDKDLAAPPGSPANGSMYIVAAGATGAWSGQNGKLAYWLTTVAAWTFITPADGWSVWVTDEAVRYERKDGAWVEQTGGVSGMANPMTAFGDMIVGGASGAPERLGAGADGKVLTIVSGAAAWAAPGGGALTYITEALATASPNNGTNAVSLSVTGGSTNADLALAPKGSGALMLRLPDATATGGNKRGQRAVDLQMNRATATQVASGNDAFAAGSNNTANVAWAVAIGYNNTSSGTASFAGGSGNTTSGAYAIALGSTNTASGSSAVAVGMQATSSGDSSFAAGNFVEANADWSIAQGHHITVRGVKGSWAYGSGPFTARGDAQRREFVLRRSTTTATPATVGTDGTVGSTLNQLTVPTNSAVKFRADVVARNSTTGDAASWAVVGLAKNVSGTVTLVGTPTATMDYNDAGASAWVLGVSADNTNKAVGFTVTGAASTNIRWVVRALSVEVVG